MRGTCAVLVSIALLGVAACESPTLTGTWVSASGWPVFHLSDAGGDISGRYVFGVIGAPTDSSAVTGRRSGTSFRLASTYYNARPMTYTGELEARPMDQVYLVGTMIVGPDSAPVVLIRRP